MTKLESRNKAIEAARSGDYQPITQLIDKLLHGQHFVRGRKIVFDYQSIISLLTKYNACTEQEAREWYEIAAQSLDERESG